MKFSKYNLFLPSKKEGNQYLFNTFNGSCYEVDNTIADIVKRASIDDLKEDVRELFTLSRVIIPDETNEDHVISYMRDHAKYSNRHHGSTVLLTGSCNLRCTYCFQGNEKTTEFMTMEQADRYIKFTLESAEQRGVKSISILLFGGEPLINMDVGFYILEKIKSDCNENKMGFSSSIITNGTLLDIETIDRLRSFNCRMIQITLDGVKEVHDRRRMYANGKGSFDEIISVLSLLNERNDIYTVIRINIDKKNISDVHDLLKYIGKDGEVLTNCEVDFGIVQTEESACAGYSSSCFLEHEIGDVLYDLWNYAESQGFKHSNKPRRKYLYCGLYSDNQYSVTPNLDIYKCLEHAGVKKHRMGRIDENGRFVDQTPAFYEWMSVDPLKNDECKNCVYLPSCGGGCGVVAYNETGSYHAKGCFKVKGTVEKQVLKFVEDIMKQRSISSSNSSNNTNTDSNG